MTGPWCESCGKHPASVRETFWGETGRVEFLTCVSCAGIQRREDDPMATPEPATTGRDQQVEALVRLYRQYGEQIGLMQERQAEIKARINGLVEVGAIGVVDGVTWQKLAPRRRFDAEKAATFLPVEVRAQCLATGLDTAKVRKAAESAGVLDAAMVDDPNAAPVLRLQ